DDGNQLDGDGCDSSCIGECVVAGDITVSRQDPPQTMTMLPTGTGALASSANGGTIYVLAAPQMTAWTSGTVAGAIAGVTGTSGAALTPDGRTLLVANAGDGTVSVIRAASVGD